MKPVLFSSAFNRHWKDMENVIEEGGNIDK